ncbi:MAG: HNH endonuclease [Georgenia sp.]
MPWTRTGDNAATYPRLMQVAGGRGADERTVNEVAGWLFRCAFQSAAHMTDYVIDAGTAWMLGGSRTDELARLAIKTGLLSKVKVNGMDGYKLIEDPEFIHIRLRKEVEWERQQRKDTRDPKLRAPVLRRDGDNCRYCGVGVQWRGQTTNRTGTLDHRHPGQAGTVTTLVVACKGCNGARQDNPQWDDDHPLRDAPAAPQYGKTTADYLTKNGYPTQANLTRDERPATAAATDPAPQRVRPAAAPGAGTAPQQSVRQVSAEVSAPGTDEMNLPGSGRVGTGLGLVVTGPPGSGRVGEDHTLVQPRRRRGRRGGKPKTSPQPQTPLSREDHTR